MINKKISLSEKLVLILILLTPFALIFSILISEIFISIIGLLGIYLILNETNFSKKLIVIKKPLIIILLFYLIVLISLFFSNDFNKSFLPSFFYFRYFLLSIVIFYIIYKFEYSLKFIFISLIVLMILVTIDSFYEYLQINGIVNVNPENYNYNVKNRFFITSFFEEEKKLGSFIVRLLPLMISLSIFLEIKILKKIKIEFLIIFLSGILIFYASERTSLLLFIVFLAFTVKIIQNRKIIFSTIFVFLLLAIANDTKLLSKYYYTTLYQFGVVTVTEPNENTKYNFKNLKYFSGEHEKLIKSGYEIFKENPLTGSGIKAYHDTCNEIRRRKSTDHLNKIEKQLDIDCSSHPHNTYIQILSDTGIFGGIIVFFIFIYIIFLNLKIFFINKISKNLKCFYILNIGIILNLMPLIPSGSFFNNWINLMIYFPIGFWFYLVFKLKSEKLNLL